MKTIKREMCPWPRTATIPHSAGRSGFECRRERAIDVATWFGLVAMIVALYGVIFIALYHWSVNAPIFQPDRGAALTQQFPWPE
jgi:hypothetical protein